MVNKIAVSAVQMHIKTNDVNANLQTIEKLTKQVFLHHKTDLLVLPEDCITGPIPDRLDLALDDNAEPIIFLKKLARDFDTFIVTGSFIKKTKGRLYNTSLLINNRGETVLEYQKSNLWHSERTYLSAGQDVKCVETPLGKIGIIICWDLADPTISRELAKQGAEIICCPAYWYRDKTGILAKHREGNEKLYIDTLCSARAIENEVLFIFANGAGEAKFFREGKLRESQQVGHSQICAPIVGCAARIDDNSEGFVTYTYDRQIAMDAEKIFKIREDINR